MKKGEGREKGARRRGQPIRAATRSFGMRLVRPGLLLMTVLSVALAAAGMSVTALADPQALAAYNAKNYLEAMRLFRPLAERGDPEAQYYVGRMYEKGQGVRKDETKVREWYRRSAEGGYAPAQYRLAVGYAFGYAGLPRHHAQAAKWLRQSAAGGYKRAQKTLARAYADGRFGLPADPEQAEYWRRQAETGP